MAALPSFNFSSRRPLADAAAAIDAGDLATAAGLAQEVLRRDRRCGAAWRLLALARELGGELGEALEAYEAALALAPEELDLANDLGRVAARLDLLELATKLFLVYRAAHPQSVEAAVNLAGALRDAHDYSGAISVLQDATRRAPAAKALWNALGTVRTAQGEPGSSLVFFGEALRLDPAYAAARYNLANAKLDLGDAEGALEDCELAMADAEHPSDVAPMALARAMMLLCCGRVGQGWDAYEARLGPALAGRTWFEVDERRWTPGEPLGGRTLLLMGEQGLGDEVMFAGIVPDLLEALGPNGRLLIAVEPRLVGLFRRSFPTAHVGPHRTQRVGGRNLRSAPELTASATIDLWTPVASPLRQFRRTLEAYPDRRRYLIPDPERVAHWRGWLAGAQGPAVGLLWKSLKLDGVRRREFCPFELWRGVLQTPGVRFVNLQYGEHADELAMAREELGVEILEPPGIDLKDDLDEVAALCSALDLVIGPANATTNIAAASGAKVWLLSTPAAWTRLGTGGYPWYPQARAFISEQLGSWGAAMTELERALSELPRD